MAFPKIGNLAPQFSLPDHAGNEHSLKASKGHIVVVYFYPKALTPGCTVQACGLRDSEKALAKRKIEVFGISGDQPKLLNKFIEKEKLNFTLLSDADHAVAEKYGVWGLKKFMGREFMGILRTTFIIDADGKLRHIIAKVNTKTHHDDVLAWIDANLE
ncbi:MAG TPA: thioredoxin-dependent thiol peroxidase [Candidatus Acidoferrum sp.]|nr:thioredoxin-dependent thiol peroxidase [Candidatus Acidoferrum sp.]